MSSLEQIIESIKSEITVDKDGKGKATIRGTARLLNVSEQTLSKQFADNQTPSKMVKTLTQQGFNVTTFSKDGVPDLALSLISDYYAHEAGRYCTEQAKLTCRAFQAYGIRSWMQDITGWIKNTPAQHYAQEQNKYDRAFLSQVLEQHNQWTCRFTKPFWQALKQCYGLTQGHRGCAPFINAYIYSVFPLLVQDRLNIVNPILSSGYRARKIHQHTNDVFVKILLWQIERITTLLQTSITQKEFQERFKLLPKHPIFEEYESIIDHRIYLDLLTEAEQDKYLDYMSKKYPAKSWSYNRMLP